MAIDWTNLKDVLTWLIGAGSPMVVGYVMSLLVENFSWWSTLPHYVKVVIPILASVLLSVLASILVGYTELLAQVQPWFQIVVSAFLAYLATQKAYMTVLDKQYGRRFEHLSSKYPKTMILG